MYFGNFKSMKFFWYSLEAANYKKSCLREDFKLLALKMGVVITFTISSHLFFLILVRSEHTQTQIRAEPETEHP